MIKLLRLYTRLRYWRLRAMQLERDLAATKAQAEAEMYRNREREDVFVSAAVLGSRGMIGLPPRSGPAAQPQQHRLVESPDPWTALNFNERAEFETEWLADAMRNGIPRQKAQNDFLLELARRKRFNDEPMN